MADVALGNLAYIQIDPTLDLHVRNLWKLTCPLGDILRFRYIDFEAGIGEDVTPSYADTDVIGRGEPYKAFTGLPSKEFSISFIFQQQEGNPLREVVDEARFLDALKYPLYSYTQDISYPPPTCILRIGALFTARVLLTGGNPQWKGPVDPATLLPDVCEFQASFSVVRRLQPDLGYRFNGLWQ